MPRLTPIRIAMRRKGREGLGFFAFFDFELVAELAFDDFLEGDIGEAHAADDVDHGLVAGIELAHALGDDIDEQGHTRDFFGGFVNKVAHHGNIESEIWGE